MVSTLGIILLIFYFICLLIFLDLKRIQEFKWCVFLTCVIISIFVNVGNFFLNFSFTEVGYVICIFTAIIASLLKREKQFLISKKSLIWLVILILVCLSGFLNLIVNSDLPYVLSMDINMDQAYYGYQFAKEASLSDYNWIAFRDIMLFSTVLLLYRGELRNKERINQFLTIVRKAYDVFFIVASIEFIMNNLFSSVLVRNFVISMLGTLDMAKTYYPEARFGYYGVTALFAEQSYVAVLIIFYAIVWKKGINSNRELFFFIFSILVLFMSGCSTGILLLPFAVLVFVREIFKTRRKGMLKFFEELFAFSVILCGLYLIVNNPLYFSEYLNSTIVKVGAFISGGKFTDNAILASGATRNYANGIAIEAFLKSPIVGVGVGGTRGYGIFPGLLASFGTAGIVAYGGFLNSIVGFSIKNRRILFIILCIYFSTILSVWYVYMLAFIPVYFIFQKEDIIDLGDNMEVLNVKR